MVGDRNKLRKLRAGIPPHKNVTLGSGENSVDVVVVALSSDDIQAIEERVETYCQANKDKVSAQVRSQHFNKILVYECMRDPSDSTFATKIAESVEEVGKFMDLEDISRVCNAYGDLMVNKAPKMEMLTSEQLDEIKNFLGVTPLSDISTVLLVHLKSCHQTIVSEK